MWIEKKNKKIFKYVKTLVRSVIFSFILHVNADFLHHFIRVAFLLNLFYSHIEHLFTKVYSIVRHINRHTVPFHSVDGIILVLSNQDLVNNLS